MQLLGLAFQAPGFALEETVTDARPKSNLKHCSMSFALTCVMLLQEWEPWFKWLVYQAILSILLRWIVKRVQTLGPWLDAAGLL